jgi:hypothetical protein
MLIHALSSQAALDSKRRRDWYALKHNDEEVDNEQSRIEAKADAHPQPELAVWRKTEVVGQKSGLDEEVHGTVIYGHHVEVL